MRRLSFFVLVLLLGSCVGAKFTADTKTGQPSSIDTLNLISAMIGPVFQPTLHLIDAAAISGKTNKIADEIIQAEEERIEVFKDDLVPTLRESLPVVIRTANELEFDGIDAYRVDKAAQSENNNFPLVLFGEGDLNFQRYGKMKNLRNEFESNNELRENVANFADKSNLSNAAICYNRLAVLSVGPFGGLRLETYLFVFDRRGKIVIEPTGLLEPVTISGKVLNEYTTELDKYEMMHNLLFVPLTKQIMQ